METIELIKLAQAGSKDAMEKILTQNSRLIWSVCARFAGRGCEKEDLYQLGTIGMIKAVKKFDTGFGVCFSTYAVPMIIGEIRRFLRDDGMIKVSRGMKERAAKVRSAAERFEMRCGRVPLLTELAEEAEMSVEETAQALEVPTSVGSLNSFVGDTDITVGECKSDEKNSGEKMTENLALKLALDSLENRERRVIEMRYFMDRTQCETARELGISQVQVSRIEKKTISRLRRLL